MNQNAKQRMQMSFEAIVSIDKDFAIAAAMEFNGLFKVNLESGECSFLQLFPDEKYNKQRMFAKAVKYQNKVIFIPASAERLTVYDLAAKEIFYLDVISEGHIGNANFNRKYKFTEALIKENILYLIPSTYPGIVCVDLRSWEISEVKIETDEKFIFRKGMCEVENSIFIPSTINNVVLEFNYHYLKVQIHHVGERNRGCWSICNSNGFFYMAPKENGSILCWDKQKDSVIELDGYPDHFDGNNFLFNKIYVNGDFLYLVPTYANMFLKVNMNDYKINELNLVDMSNTKSIAFLSEEKAHYLLRKENLDGSFEFLIMNTINNEIKRVDFYLLSEHEIWKAIIEKEKCFREIKGFNLECFLKGITYLSNNSTEEVYEVKRMFGKQIETTLTT